MSVSELWPIHTIPQPSPICSPPPTALCMAQCPPMGGSQRSQHGLHPSHASKSPPTHTPNSATSQPSSSLSHIQLHKPHPPGLGWDSPGERDAQLLPMGTSRLPLLGLILPQLLIPDTQLGPSWLAQSSHPWGFLKVSYCKFMPQV